MGCLCYQVPTPKLLLLKVAADATSSPQPHGKRTPPPQSNARATEENRGKELSSTLRRKKAREGGERRGKCLNLGIYLLKHRKNTHTAPRWQKSQQSELRSFASSQCLSRASQELSPSLTHTQKHTEDQPELPSQSVSQV